MLAEFFWRSQTGPKAEENRDHCGIGIRDDEALCIVLDGSTHGRESGELVRRIASHIVDWYVAAESAITPGAITTRLGLMHPELSRTFPQASASYVLVHVDGRGATAALWAGDCLLGRRGERGGIEWLCQPHTLANAFDVVHVAAVAGLTTRHLITRSFRAREFMSPEVLGPTPADELILATDGFWAELGRDEQDAFLDEMQQPGRAYGDDRSVLRIRFSDTPAGQLIRRDVDSESLYVRARGLGGQ